MARGAPSGSSTRMSRWRPTPEQLMVLQELFMRRGVRTPTAHQIQRITQQLKQFGKVETKNVFYWFQNHKAREKQKLRKSTSLLLNYYGGVQGGKNGNFQQQQPNFLYYCPLLGPRPPLSIDHSCEFRPFIPAVQMISRGNNQGVIEISAGDSSEHRNASSTEDQNRCNGTTNDSVSADRHDNNPEVDDQRLSGGECVITWMNDVVVDSITSRRPPLKTLQLFPTSSSSSSSSSMSGN